MTGFSGPIQGVPKSVPMQWLRSAVIELWNLLLILGLTGRRRFSRNTPSKFASVEKIPRIRKCLSRVYLQTRGEVAEWPKAAVC